MIEQKYEVKKGRTVTCKMGVAHEGAKLGLSNFTGDEDQAQAKIDAAVKVGALEKIPFTADEEKAIAEEAKRVEDAEKQQKEAEEARIKAESERKDAILGADFDKMNKDPMIEFAEKWGIELSGSKADEIREELKAIQDTLLENE